MADELFAPLPLQIAIQLERVRHRLVTGLDRDLWARELTFASLRALIAVADAPGGVVHAGELGRSMRISRQAAAMLLKRLAAIDAVELFDEGWARSARVTDVGREYARDGIGAAGRTLEALTKLTAAERMELFRLLRKLDSSLKAVHPYLVR